MLLKSTAAVRVMIPYADYKVGLTMELETYTTFFYDMLLWRIRSLVILVVCEKTTVALPINLHNF